MSGVSYEFQNLGKWLNTLTYNRTTPPMVFYTSNNTITIPRVMAFHRSYRNKFIIGKVPFRTGVGGTLTVM